MPELVFSPTIVRRFPLNSSTSCLPRTRGRVRAGTVLGLATTGLLLAGCSSNQLPPCVTGASAPTPAQSKLWKALPAASTLDLAIDGSGSMLGLTGSEQASQAWKALLKGVTLAAAANGLTLQTNRLGSGESSTVTSPLQATDRCYFEGCGAFKPVSSSLNAHWEAPGLSKGQVPLRVAISDLEVNDGDIAKLIGAISPHVTQGAVVGVLAMRLPFNGRVYNSQGVVIHSGEAKRPVYLLATGPRGQLHSFLTDLQTKAALAGVPTDEMHLTFLDDQANAPTLIAKSVTGVPPEAISGGLPIRVAGATYSPAANNDYQFAKLYGKAEGITLSSRVVADSPQLQPDLALIRLEPIALPGHSSGFDGLSVKGFQLNGQELSVAIRIPETSASNVVRAFIPRGQLPEAWWLSWNRQHSSTNQPHNRTDGLLLLMTSLSKLMVAPEASPAAALCLAYSR